MLWEFLNYTEVDRIDALVRRKERFDLASLVRIAVLDADALESVEAAFGAECAAGEPEPERPFARDEVAGLINEFAPLMRSPRWQDATPKPLH